MKAWPLRRQITFWTALTSGAALTVFCAVVAFNIHTEQVEALDEQMAIDAHILFDWLRSGDSAALEESTWYQSRLRGDGALHGFLFGPTRAASFSRAHPERLAEVVDKWPPERWSFTRRTDGVRLRFGVFEQRDMTLILAASLDAVDESVWELGAGYLVAMPWVIAVVAAGSWWIASRAMRPIGRIASAAESITASRLQDRRLSTPDSCDEIAQLVRVLNDMFDRLQQSFEQVTRFTADASHELRTPLTILRGHLEEALRSGRPDPERERLLGGLLEETSNLQKIAENLLLLSRFDVGKNEIERTEVNLSALVNESREDAGLLAEPRQIEVEAQIAPNVSVLGDATLIRRVLTNLVDNAVRYNHSGGRIRLQLSGDSGGGASVGIGNTGPGIPGERQGALFQRFFRVESDRSRRGGGSGLGLSLCREIMRAHGGEILLSRSDAQWTEFTLRFAAPDATVSSGNANGVMSGRGTRSPGYSGAFPVRGR